MYLLEWDHKYYTVPHHLYPFEIWKSAAALCVIVLCAQLSNLATWHQFAGKVGPAHPLTGLGSQLALMITR